MRRATCDAYDCCAVLCEFQSTLSMRRATWRMRLWRWRKIFQSTLSMRRATNRLGTSNRNAIFQSTLSMRRATFIITQTPHYHQISIHALHEESDSDATTANSKADSFQSTLSMRRATQRLPRCDHIRRISIHALHEESDQHMRAVTRRAAISIHALHEESDCWKINACPHSILFQSTLSMRRATRTLWP